LSELARIESLFALRAFLFLEKVGKEVLRAKDTQTAFRSNLAPDSLKFGRGWRSILIYGGVIILVNT
jgi:hypothetical protein